MPVAILDRFGLARAAQAELDRRRRLEDQKVEAEGDLMAFVRMFWRCVEPETPLVEGWALDMMCDVLMSVTDGHSTREIINVPPGFCKSLLLCVFWPAWEWGPCNMPHLRYLNISYSVALPERDNARFARVVNDPTYQRLWGDRVKVVRQGAGLVENSATGWKRAASTGGGVTGHRSDRILIDDANNPNDVESDDVRQATVRWLREVMPDRLNNQETGVIINLQQRTHEQDATGTLAEFGSGYRWTCIPMEFDPLRICQVVLRPAEGDEDEQIWIDPRALDADGNLLEGLYTDAKGEAQVRMGSAMAKAEGRLAWPERFSADAVEKLKQIKGRYAFAGQYQQAPTIRGGGVILREWWQPWTGRRYPEVGTTVLSIDTALEQGQENDWNASTGWGAFADANTMAPQFILMSAWRDKLPLAQLVTRITEQATEIKADYILIEHKTRGRDLADEIVRLNATAPWQVILVPPKGDKVQRLNSVSHFFSGDVRKAPPTRDPATGAEVPGIDVWSGGMVWAPDTDWADDVISEVAAFPRGAHDDWCDCVSLALSWMRRNGVVLRRPEHEAIETERRRFRPQQRVPYAL